MAGWFGCFMWYQLVCPELFKVNDMRKNVNKQRHKLIMTTTIIGSTRITIAKVLFIEREMITDVSLIMCKESPAC